MPTGEEGTCRLGLAEGDSLFIAEPPGGKPKGFWVLALQEITLRWLAETACGVAQRTMPDLQRLRNQMHRLGRRAQECARCCRVPLS
jgi:hypothetical protein